MSWDGMRIGDVMRNEWGVAVRVMEMKLNFFGNKVANCVLSHPSVLRGQKHQ